MTVNMNIARIADGVVTNIEVADDEWIAANQGIDAFTFVAYTDENPGHIGLSWTEEEGFEQPPALVEEVTGSTTEGAE
jgi:hypothetical protein